MEIKTAVKYVQSAMDSYSESPLMVEAWQTLKAAVLAQQTNNSVRGAIIASLDAALVHLDKSEFGDVAGNIIVANQLLHP